MTMTSSLLTPSALQEAYNLLRLVEIGMKQADKSTIEAQYLVRRWSTVKPANLLWTKFSYFSEIIGKFHPQTYARSYMSDNVGRYRGRTRSWGPRWHRILPVYSARLYLLPIPGHISWSPRQVSRSHECRSYPALPEPPNLKTFLIKYLWAIVRTIIDFPAQAKPFSQKTHYLFCP